MSKFCSNCGNMMNDTDMVCSACGMQYAAPAQAAAPVQNNGYDPYAGYNAPAQAPQAKNTVPAPVGKAVDFVKKNLPIVAGALAVIVVLIIIIACAGGGYKKAIKKYYKALYSGDAKAYTQRLSIIRTNGDDDPDEDDYEDYVDLYADDFEDDNGKFKSVKVKVTDVDKYDRDEIEDYVDDYCSDDVDSDDIKKLYEVDCKITIKGKDGHDSDKYTILVSKEKGGWKIAGVSSN